MCFFSCINLAEASCLAVAVDKKVNIVESADIYFQEVAKDASFVADMDDKHFNLVPLANGDMFGKGGDNAVAMPTWLDRIHKRHQAAILRSAVNKATTLKHDRQDPLGDAQVC